MSSVNKRVDYIRENSAFYKMGYRKLLTALLVLLLLAIFLVAFILYQNATRPIPLFFASTLDGRLLEIKPIAVP